MEYDRQGMGRVWPGVYLQRYISDFYIPVLISSYGDI